MRRSSCSPFSRSERQLAPAPGAVLLGFALLTAPLGGCSDDDEGGRATASATGDASSGLGSTTATASDTSASTTASGSGGTGSSGSGSGTTTDSSGTTATTGTASASATESGTTDNSSSGSATTTGSTTDDSSGTSATASGSGTATSGVRFDVGIETTGSSTGIDTQESGCKKVDVILAVDNSGSMQEEVGELRGPVFNTLPMQLLSVGEGGIDDFHLAVINGCPKPGRFHNWGKSGACNFSTGANYMVSDSPALVDEFACVSDISDRGYDNLNDECRDSGMYGDDDEQPAMSGAASLTQPANAGFLRDDAILFVFAITDEDEELDGASNDPAMFGITPAEMAAQYVAGKGGRAQDIVFLGVGGAQSCDGPYGSAQNARQLRNVVDELNNLGARASFWDLCQGDLPGAFASVITDVDQACDEFVPPG